MRRFQVEVVSRQKALYHVEAPDATSAERQAIRKWQSGQPSELDPERNRYLALQDPSAAAHAERASHDMYADAAYDEMIDMHPRARVRGKLEYRGEIEEAKAPHISLVASGGQQTA